MNENYGYLLIDTEEKKKKFGPIREGDEVQSVADKSWHLVVTLLGIQFPKESYQVFRRPLVLPDSDYELVPFKDGVIQWGDEYCTNRENRWFAYGRDQFTQPERAQQFLNNNPDIVAIRRRKSKPQGEKVQDVQGTWISVKDGLPRENTYCWTCNSQSERPYLNYFENGQFSELAEFWIPLSGIEFPALPEVLKIEKSFLTWYHAHAKDTTCSFFAAQIIFTAGYEAGKGANQ